MAFEELGYNGRALKIRKDGVVIAAVRTKTITHGREPVDVTSDDSNSNRTLLPVPGMRQLDVSIEGVSTVDNYQDFLTNWNGDLFQDVTIEHPDGSIEEAEHGFFLGNLEQTGEYNGHVAFTAQLMSSGAMTVNQS
jgi:predicted secreted protein